MGAEQVNSLRYAAGVKAVKLTSRPRFLTISDTQLVLY
jgi:hypothetical protein